MPKTGFYCEYDLKDTTALADSAPMSEYNQSFGNILLLKENVETKKYGTLEQDFFLLDGVQQELADTVEDIAYFSSELSGADGSFEENPAIEISFTENHSSVGITLYFQDEYPLEMLILWYDLWGIQISKKEFKVDGLTFFARNQVEDFAKLKIIFTRTKPYHYVKLRYLEYGTTLIMGEGGMPVKGASLVEETDRLSDKLAINKLSYKLIDSEDDFNVGNMSGLHKVLQKRQSMEAFEVVNGTSISLGTYFLDSFKTDKNVAAISAVDLKGLLDDYRFMNGRVYDGEAAANVIREIFVTAGIEEYELAAELEEIKLYGWLKIQTCRKALREVLFACGAVIDSRKGIRIYIPGNEIEANIKRTRKFSTTVYDQEYISDVSVKYAEYVLKEEISQICKGTYEPGTYTIEFSSPAAELEINVGTILELACNYVKFQIEEASEVIISGKTYTKQELIVTAALPEISAGKIRKTKNYTCTVVGTTRALKIAEAILQYYTWNIGLKVRFLNESETPGMWAEVQNNKRRYGNYCAGIEKMTTDLTGGFISTAEMRGFYKLAADIYYTGELIAGDDVGVM